MNTTTTKPRGLGGQFATDESFTPDELAAILREASRRQSSRDVASLDQALETARELGIDEQHVLAAADAHRKKRERRDELHALTLREREKLARIAWSAALVTAIVTIAASWNVAQLALIGLSIGAVAQGFRWLRAEIKERTDTA
ncbi:MAG: hypothetical protein HYU52_15965 [Acidobacteria bacterium]|nr:hypothetical protein [Acidobacteriota bacterium]